MFKLLSISDIIDKHKGKPAVIECHGPSANENRQIINELCLSDELVSFAINEWHEFENRVKPDYWLRSFPQRPSIEYDYEYYNKFTGGEITLLSCDVVDKSTMESAVNNLKCPYLPFDLRHFDKKSCWTNFQLLEENTYLPKYFTFFPDCCSRAGRLTLQEELKNYTNHTELYSPSTHTSSINMFSFAILMGCNPIYINGMDLDYHGPKGHYANVKGGGKVPPSASSLPGNSWSDWRKNWIIRDFNIVNESAKKIGVEILNLNHNTWYKIFKHGNL